MLSNLTNRSAWRNWLVAAAFCSAGAVPTAHGDEDQPAATAPAAVGKPAAAAPNTPQTVPADVATMLLTAMRNNPDVAVSQSDVDEAEAELNRVRQDVARQVVVARAAVASQRQKVGLVKHLLEQHVVSKDEVQFEEFKLDPLEADLRYLLGGAEFRFEAKDENGGATWTEMGLSTMLTTAMEKNPDIVLAKAKLRGAQAALNRTRLNVARQVITLKDSIRRLRVQYDRMYAAFNIAKSVSDSELAEAMAKLSAAQAELEYVLGRPNLDELPKAREP